MVAALSRRGRRQSRRAPQDIWKEKKRTCASPPTRSRASAGLGETGTADVATLPPRLSQPLCESLSRLWRGRPSLRSRSRAASHSARVRSAFSRCSADCRRHSARWPSYSSFHSASAASGPPALVDASGGARG